MTGLQSSIPKILLPIAGFIVGFSVFYLATGRSSDGPAKVERQLTASQVPGNSPRQTPKEKIDELFLLSSKPMTLARDRQLYDLIQGFSAEEMRSIGAEILLRKGEIIRMQQVGEALLVHWMEVDSNSAFAWLESTIPMLPQALRYGYFFLDDPWLFEIPARKRPEWLLETALNFKGDVDDGPQSDCLQAAGAELARRNPEKARQRIAAIEDEKMRGIAMVGYVVGLLEKDPDSAFSYAKTITDRHTRKAALGKIIDVIGRQGIGRITEMLNQLSSEEDKDALLWRGLSSSASSYPQETRASVVELLSRANKLDPGNGELIATQLARADLNNTVEWLSNLDPNLRSKLGLDFEQGVLSMWIINSDRKAPLEWLIQQQNKGSESNDDRRQVLFRNTFGHWLSSDVAGARAWIDQLPQGKLREQAELAYIGYVRTDLPEALRCYPAAAAADLNGTVASELSTALAEKDPVDAINWALKLPTGNSRSKALQQSASAWLFKDPSEATKWIEELPVGLDQDYVAMGFGEETAKGDPEAATEWVDRVTDPKIRSAAAWKVYQQWKSIDPGKARDWLANLEGIDDAAKRTFHYKIKIQ